MLRETTRVQVLIALAPFLATVFVGIHLLQLGQEATGSPDHDGH